MHRLASLWLNLLGSLWFVPGVLVLAGVGAALLLVELHPLIDLDLAQDWPRLFGAGAEGARGMLSAIATSMITVAGVVFSVTIVALSLTASQYSPRVLRNFMSDRSTQVVLGAFVAVFAYCLIVLRTIRGGDEGGFVPSLAVLGGVFMAFVGIGLLIYFVHHVATAIQVDYILERIATDTREAIDRLYPAGVGEERPPTPHTHPPCRRTGRGRTSRPRAPVTSSRSTPRPSSTWPRSTTPCCGFCRRWVASLLRACPCCRSPRAVINRKAGGPTPWRLA